MQQRFGGDERFRLDERFADDDIEDENIGEEKSNSQEVDDIQSEKKMSISVLEKVLGKSLNVDTKKEIKLVFLSDKLIIQIRVADLQLSPLRVDIDQPSQTK